MTAALVGARSPEQVRRNVRAAQAIPHERIWKVVDGIADGYRSGSARR